MAGNYADNALEVAPPWLQGPNGRSFLRAFGAQKDWLSERVRDAVKARFPGTVAPVKRRTNLLTRSNQFSHASWLKTSVTVSANSGVAPNGIPGLSSVLTKSAAALGNVRKLSVSGLTVGEVYTFSVYVQSPSVEKRHALRVVNGPLTTVEQFDTEFGTHYTDSGTPPFAAGIEVVKAIQTVVIVPPSEEIWYRLSLSFVAASSTADLYIYPGVYGAPGGVVVYAWEAQLTQGLTGPVIDTPADVPVTVEEYTPLSPSDALPLTGQERGLARGYAETESQYRERLVNAFEAWRWAGTPFGLLRAFQIAGFPSVILQCQSGTQYTLAGATGKVQDLVPSPMPGPVHLGGTPAELWSDIGILITQPWPIWWGGVAPADGSPDCLTAKALITAWKGAWNRCVKLNVVSGPVWGGFTWGSFTWGSGTSVTWTPPAG